MNLLSASTLSKQISHVLIGNDATPLIRIFNMELPEIQPATSLLAVRYVDHQAMAVRIYSISAKCPYVQTSKAAGFVISEDIHVILN